MISLYRMSIGRVFKCIASAAAGLGICAAFAITTSPAQAEQRAICVQCLEPDVTYKCEARAAAQHQQFLTNERLIRMACIRHIAKSSGHAACKVSQDQPEICPGEPYAIDISQMAQSYVDRLPSAVRKQITTPGPKQSEAQGGDDKSKPPKTVVEMAKRSAENSQKQLENVGTAVKNAGDFVSGTAKQTWNCLASLFQDC